MKLNTNECPYPPSPRVAEAILREVGADGARCGSIRTRRARRLRAAVARLHGLAAGERLHRQRLRRHPEPARALLLRPGGGGRLHAAELFALSGAGRASRTEPRLPSALDRDHAPSRGEDRRLRGARSSSSPRRTRPRASASRTAEIRSGPRRLRRPARGRRGLCALRARERRGPRSPAHPNLVVVRTLSKAYALAGHPGRLRAGRPRA